MSEASTVLEKIEEHRAKIDEIDKQLVALLTSGPGHFAWSSAGSKPGREHGPVAIPSAQEEIFEKVDSYNEGPLYNENLREIYASILKVMKETPSV